MRNIKRKCNSMVKLSKFTYNKNILSKFVAKFCLKTSFLNVVDYYNCKDQTEMDPN